MLSLIFCLLICFATQSMGALIKGIQSGKCLNVAGAGWQNGVKVITMTCNPDAANYQWFAEPAPNGNGYYLKSQNMKKCLNVYGGGTANNADLVQWDCVNSANSIWNFREYNGDYQIVGLGSNKCVNIYGANTADGARVVLWDCVGAQNELFDIGEGPGSALSKLVDNLGGDFIKNPSSGKCVNVADASWQNNANDIISTCDPNAANYKWIVERSPTQDGYFLRSLNVNPCSTRSY